MQHWLQLADRDPAALRKLVTLAADIKAGRTVPDAIAGKILTMVFFNPSLRTRTSFEAAMARFGGSAICLSVGGDTWQLEHRGGAVMNGAASEHVREAAAVLSRYGDALAVRSFAKMNDAREDARDPVLHGFAEHATVPLINMESAVEHPCQGLADWLTMHERLGDTAGRRFVLSWAPHIKPLPRAVPHSAVLAAAAAGMHVTIAHPSGYQLDPDVITQAEAWTAAAGTTLTVTDQQVAATRAADVVYAKSWGAVGLYGDAPAQAESFRTQADWQITPGHLSATAHLLHCLPVRRNVVISDAALDQHHTTIVDQAENRLWTQAAILQHLFTSQER